MTERMSSRERMLAALNFEKPDHVPMAFMIFTALNKRLNKERRNSDPTVAIEAQIELGLDTVVDLRFFSPQISEIGHSDAPAFLEELLDIIKTWNEPRMQAFLEYGVNLFIRRAWYEGTDFWSPKLYRQFFLPIIREEVRLAHEAGAKYGYILTSGSMPLHDMLIELDIDILIGPDPVQGKGTDLKRMGQQLMGKICIWGGINGFITVEKGTKEDIDTAVCQAMEALGSEGLILSPVDNVRDPSDEVWENVLALIESWKKYRG